MEVPPQRTWRIQQGWDYYIIEGAKMLLLIGVLVTLIIIAVCLCRDLGKLPSMVRDIRDAIHMLKALAPCLADQFCPPPIMV